LTGNDLVTMSADAFVLAIKPVFLSTRPDSRISVVQDSLHACLVQPISEALRQEGATTVRHTDITQLRYERDRISGVLLEDGSLVRADWYVAALPPHQLTPLLPERWLTRYGYFQQLAELQFIDRTILHVHVEQPCATPRLVLLSDTSIHSVLVTAITPDRTGFSLITTDSQFAQVQLDSQRDDAIPERLQSWGLLTPGFPRPFSRSSLGPSYIDPFNAVRLQTCCWLVVGPIQAGLPTSKVPLPAATAALMRSRADKSASR